MPGNGGNAEPGHDAGVFVRRHSSYEGRDEALEDVQQNGEQAQLARHLLRDQEMRVARRVLATHQGDHVESPGGPGNDVRRRQGAGPVPDDDPGDRRHQDGNAGVPRPRLPSWWTLSGSLGYSLIEVKHLTLLR